MLSTVSGIVLITSCFYRYIYFYKVYFRPCREDGRRTSNGTVRRSPIDGVFIEMQCACLRDGTECPTAPLQETRNTYPKISLAVPFRMAIIMSACVYCRLYAYRQPLPARRRSSSDILIIGQWRTNRRCACGSLCSNDFPHIFQVGFAESLRVSPAGSDIAGQLREH